MQPQTSRLAIAIVAACFSCAHPSADDRVTCAQYFDHTSLLTGMLVPKPYGEGELAFCQRHTQEQLRCVLAANTVDDDNLCEIADTAQRAVARRVLPSVKRSWPGSADLMAVLTKTVGCGFGGFTPSAGPLSETDVFVSFSIRDATTPGDPQIVIARMRREAEDWKCVVTDPDGACGMLERTCKPTSREPAAPPK